ncbi:secreted RxLR effector protein 161-like [Humulus lupulus]|uniref:secreted RxLR effector protein 161-like n=1 Tax=Humulus lupulus TaxID=3486 RepID=UPI002B41577A|nr:secreted RxLR effector protein 161-like [Humulus lupulus]
MDLGTATRILGITKSKDREKGKMNLGQKDYIQKILDKFSMNNAKITKLPITSQHQLSKEQCPKTKDEADYMNRVPYSNAVRFLMYLMVCTRPDLSYAMSLLSKYMSNPGKPHLEAMKWTLRYLLGTMDIGLTYRKQNYILRLEGYSDADYAGDRDQRRLTSAYYFLIGGNCISWRVQLQPVVALSTTES